MKTIALLSLVFVFTAGQAMGLGLIAEGTGYLSMDPDNLHTASSFDFNQDGLPNLVQMMDNEISVPALDGSTLWTATIDTLAICPTCNDPDGWWGFYFEGFFSIEPGQYDAVIQYYYDEIDTGFYIRGILVISTADSSVRYMIPNRYLEAAVDLDGDNLKELVLYGNDGSGGDSPFWEVWGYNGVTSVPRETQNLLRVSQNQPNPFNPKTTVNFELAEASAARVEIHDASGRQIFQRSLGRMEAGPHQFTWNGVDRRGARVASGAYIVTIVAGNERQTRKMMLLK